MKNVLRLAIALFALSSYAQLTPPSFGLPAAKTPSHVKLALDFDKPSYNAGDAVHGTVKVKIEESWHINSAHPLESFAIPSTVKITSPSLKVGEVTWPPHVERALAFAGGAKVAVYEGTVELPFTATAQSGGDGAVHVTLHYQACNDSVCLAPRDAKLDGRVVVGGAATPAAAAAPAKPAVAAPVAGTAATTTAPAPVPVTASQPLAVAQPNPPPVSSTKSFTPLSAAPAGERAGLFSGDIAGIFRSRGLLLTLVAIFFVGLALNLTPCVYPLIPITLAFFASQTAGRKSRQVALASAYVAGLAGMYAGLGVVAALTGSLFGSWLQSPAVLIFFAVLMLVLAASMFGAFEIAVPHFITDRSGAKSGYAGALVMGLFAGVVAAPCVGPVVVSLIALVSQLHDPVVGTAMFVVLALGLGFPYLIGLSSLPRSGAWMVTIKKALGFILIAMAFYFLRGVAGEQVFHWGAAVSLLLGALFLLVRKDAGSGRALSYALAVLLLVGGVFFIPRRAGGSELAWEPFSDARIAAARAAGKPVMIDFYADWCIPCKELDAKTFRNPAVAAESERFVRLKADLTRSDDAATAALAERFAILGVPTVVFLDARGEENAAARLTGMEEPESFVARLQKTH